MELDALTRQFAATRPTEVADLLAVESDAELAAFIEALPPAIAAPVAARLPSRQLHDLMASLPSARVAQLLLNAEHQDVVSMLSHLSADRYDAILAASVGPQKARLARLFSFPVKTISAIATPDFIRVDVNTTCAELRAELIASERVEDLPIFVIDHAGVFQGILFPLAVLAERNALLPVTQVMQDIDALTGQTPIESVLEVPQWLTARALPVVDPEGQILGAITMLAVQRSRAEARASRFGMEDVLEFAALSYLDLCSDLLDIGIGRDINEHR